MNKRDTFGAKMVHRFLAKGWHIEFSDKVQDRIVVIPPEKLNAQHLMGIYIPVLRHTWQPDPKREWWAAIWNKNSFLGPQFEASAHPNDVELFAAFATWIGDLARNPEKFT
jgi:hypothetical protein